MEHNLSDTSPLLPEQHLPEIDAIVAALVADSAPSSDDLWLQLQVALAEEGFTLGAVVRELVTKSPVPSLNLQGKVVDPHTGAQMQLLVDIRVPESSPTPHWNCVVRVAPLNTDERKYYFAESRCFLSMADNAIVLARCQAIHEMHRGRTSTSSPAGNVKDFPTFVSNFAQMLTRELCA